MTDPTAPAPPPPGPPGPSLPRDGGPPPRRNRRGPLIAAAALIAAATIAAGVWLAAGRGGDPQPAASPSPSAAPTDAPTASQDPSPSPTPATPEEQAAADLDALVRGFRDAEDRAYLDPAVDPSAAFDPYLRNPVSEEEVVRVLTFRRNGNTITANSTEVHGVQVTALDLAADPATATVVECKTLTATGADADGQPRTLTNPRKKVEWTARYIPAAGWRLYTASASEENTC